jgi:UPF0716 protein FxsA
MWIILGILALPLVEIALFVTVGAKLGLWLTLAWVLLSAMGGVLVLKGLARSGSAMAQSDFVEGFRGRMAEDPLSPIVHQGLIAVAAILLILPGFFTDTLGILLLIPPVRTLFIRLTARRLQGVKVVPRDFT